MYNSNEKVGKFITFFVFGSAASSTLRGIVISRNDDFFAAF